MQTTSIRIVSINTWKCDGDYFQRIQVMASQLGMLKPDIIACQECFQAQNGAADTLEFLANELRMNAQFVPARLKERKINNWIVNSFSGLGVLSRFPITMYKSIDLPFSDEDGERKTQFVRVAIPNGHPVLIVNVHFTHLENATELRKEQMKVVANEIRCIDCDTKIVCGDFNAEEDSGELRFMKDYLGMSMALILSNDIPNPFQISRKVDHIFSLPYKDGSYPIFSNSNYVLNSADGETGVFPSDHPGILTTLNIPIHENTLIEHEKSQSIGY